MFYDDLDHPERSFEFELPHCPAASNSQEPDMRESASGKGQCEANGVMKGILTNTTSSRVVVRLKGWEKPGGDIVWRGARVLCADLLRFRLSLKGARILELGASSGLPAALCASLGAHALATDGSDHIDMFGRVPLLEANAQLFADDLALGGSFSAAALNWGLDEAVEAEKEAEASMSEGNGDSIALAPLRRGSFDFVIGSDISYDPKFIPKLAESMAFFVAEGGRVILAHTAVATTSNHAEAQLLMVAKLEALGFRCVLEHAPSGAAFQALPDLDLSASSYILYAQRRH
mmetsp:Transcript_66944/g.131947  ORF Transcript_66944/g.131947 Transcript_66944/m.131947 type:complete len:290 (-) Transcript_66944:117-986(-)